MIIWTKDDLDQMMVKMRSSEGQSSNEYEVYLAGNVEIRQKDGKNERNLKAKEVYYDVGAQCRSPRHGRQHGIQGPAGSRSFNRALQRNSPIVARFVQGKRCLPSSSSKLPSDPSLTINVTDATHRDDRYSQDEHIRDYLHRSEDEAGSQYRAASQIFTGENMIIGIEDIPVFYFPYVRRCVNNPLGPLESFSFSQNNILNAQFLTRLGSPREF